MNRGRHQTSFRCTYSSSVNFFGTCHEELGWSLTFCGAIRPTFICGSARNLFTCVESRLNEDGWGTKFNLICVIYLPNMYVYVCIYRRQVPLHHRWRVVVGHCGESRTSLARVPRFHVHVLSCAVGQWWTRTPQSLGYGANWWPQWVYNSIIWYFFCIYLHIQ